jgi:putative ribosome biogenesis GTPase RsgA
VEISKEELRNLQRIEKQEEEKYLQSKSTIASLLETSIILSEAKKLEDEEIIRLERALQMAREKNVNTVMKLATVDVALSSENKASEVHQFTSCCD